MIFFSHSHAEIWCCHQKGQIRPNPLHLCGLTWKEAKIYIQWRKRKLYENISNRMPFLSFFFFLAHTYLHMYEKGLEGWIPYLRRAASGKKGVGSTVVRVTKSQGPACWQRVFRTSYRAGLGTAAFQSSSSWGVLRGAGLFSEAQ